MEEILSKDNLSYSNIISIINALNNPKNINILEVFISEYFNIPLKYLHNNVYLVEKNHHKYNQVCALVMCPDDILLVEMNF